MVAPWKSMVRISVEEPLMWTLLPCKFHKPQDLSQDDCNRKCDAKRRSEQRNTKWCWGQSSTMPSLFLHPFFCLLLWYSYLSCRLLARSAKLLLNQRRRVWYHLLYCHSAVWSPLWLTRSVRSHAGEMLCSALGLHYWSTITKHATYFFECVKIRCSNVCAECHNWEMS